MTRRFSRRQALTYLAAGGAATVAMACSTVLPNSPPTALPSNQPRTGGSLRVGVLGVLGGLLGLDGHLTTGLDSLRRVWDVLSILDEKLNTVPVLVENLDLTPDACQMTLKLRTGIQFHTGRELTSEDLVWNFTRLQDPKVNPIYANLVKPFVGFETPDKYTLRVQFDQPNPFVVDALPNLSIIDPVSFGQSGVNKPVGTGPFTFGEYAQGDHLTLQKNPNYWDTGKPYLDELRFRIFSDPQALMTDFDGGALDVALQPTLIDWVRTRSEGKAQALINQNSGNYMGAAFNMTRPLTLLWYPTSPAYDASKDATYAFDLDKARALLAQSGASDVALDFN
jgi:peptide/nickel transport system substrate-binding protein